MLAVLESELSDANDADGYPRATRDAAMRVLALAQSLAPEAVEPALQESDNVWRSFRAASSLT